MSALETRRMVAAALAAAESKKAEDLRVLELDPADSGFTDFFLIASASNERQSQAIAEEIQRKLKRDFRALPNSVEGLRGGEWVLMDYVDFVVHVFLKEKRAYYNIERLRTSAKVVDPKQWKARRRKSTVTATAAPRKRKSPTKKPSPVRARAATPKPAPRQRKASSKTSTARPRTAKSPK